MRLLLDVHLSPRKIGAALAREGHTVLCAAGDPTLCVMPDGDLLQYATEHDFIVVTCDSDDFPALHWERVRQNTQTCGVLLSSLPNNAYGPTLRAIRSALEHWPRQDEWLNRLIYIPN